MIRIGKESLKWPKIMGVVIESYAEKSIDNKGLVLYSPKIIVKYNVDDNEFQTNPDQIDSFGSYSTSSFSKIQEIVSRYPKNKNVDVYYNPDKPNEAVLEPGVSIFSRIAQYFAYFLLLVAFLILGKFIIMVGVFGIFVVNFFKKKKFKNSNFDLKENPEASHVNQPLNDNQISNQNKEMNFKDDGFSQ
jgi:hypothetical protein